MEERTGSWMMEQICPNVFQVMIDRVSFFMLVPSFSGLYCSITHLHVHVYQCQSASLMNTQQLYFSLHVNPLTIHTHITHIQVLHNIAGPLVPYNYVRPKQGLIHRDRESSVIRPLLYLQATTAGLFILLFLFFSYLMKKPFSRILRIWLLFSFLDTLSPFWSKTQLILVWLNSSLILH